MAQHTSIVSKEFHNQDRCFRIRAFSQSTSIIVTDHFNIRVSCYALSCYSRLFRYTIFDVQFSLGKYWGINQIPFEKRSIEILQFHGNIFTRKEDFISFLVAITMHLHRKATFVMYILFFLLILHSIECWIIVVWKKEKKYETREAHRNNCCKK